LRRKALVHKETEMASLGSCLLDREALNATFENLKVQDFESPNHRIIFTNIRELVKESSPVDLVTIVERLQKNDKLQVVGGVAYLTTLIKSVPTVQNIEHYNSLIRREANLRKIRGVLQELQMDKISIPEALEQVEKIPIVEIAEEDLKTLLKNTLLVSTEGVAHTFEIDSLNQYLGGIDKGEIVTLGGFTSQGKTSLAIQLAISFAENPQKKVLYLTSEMTPLETSRRILANLMPKNIMDFRKGIFQPKEREALSSIADIVGEQWNLNIKKIFDVSDIRKYVRKYSPELVFIDYLQNLDRRGARSDYERVTGNIKDIQGLTLETEISTFVLSQLSRNKEGVREPRITDLRDSGRIEECSNVVMLIYWENRMKLENQTRKGGEVPEKIQVSIVKNRDGTIGRLCLDFEPEYCRVKESIYEDYGQGSF